MPHIKSGRDEQALLRQAQLMHYTMVFDAATHPYRGLIFVLPGVVFVMLGAIMVFLPGWLEAVLRRPLRQRYIFRWFFFLFSVLWTVMAGPAQLIDATRASQSAQPGRCKIVEGRVEHFHPMPAQGHDVEHFDVRGVEFSYSDYIITAGFNNTASHGGPIREGLPVRICYRDGEILRLQVARL
jgi:hypothetical protein